jgi:calcineurin-like phosphoesterase family protein
MDITQKPSEWQQNKGSGRIFFTSDSHFGHGNIIKYCHRPFLGERDKEELSRIGVWHDGNWKGEDSSRWRMSDEAIDLMDRTLIDEINKIVGEKDILWHLGDFAMPDKRKHNHYNRCRYYRDQIRCQNVSMIWGNHDVRSIRDLFTQTYDLYMLRPSNYPKVVMCHYAMAVWESSHRGNLHLYGHSHSEAEPWLEKTLVGRRSMDVGVDNAAKILGSYRPFTFDEIVGRLSKRAGFAFDHHVDKMANTPKEEELN